MHSLPPSSSGTRRVGGTWATNLRVADGLLAHGRISEMEHDRAVAYAQGRRVRIEDAIVELGILGEVELLRYIATVHRTRFLSTEKLARAVIHPHVMRLVSVKTAELHNVFPVLYDGATGALTVVTADPDDDAALQEIRIACASVRRVAAVVARPAAVRAAIACSYRGQVWAFRALEQRADVLDYINGHAVARAAND